MKPVRHFGLSRTIIATARPAPRYICGVERGEFIWAAIMLACGFAVLGYCLTR